LLCRFQIYVFVAARHARLKVRLDRNPTNLKSGRGSDFATAHHLFSEIRLPVFRIVLLPCLIGFYCSASWGVKVARGQVMHLFDRPNLN
jgi:hypothetical protein